LKELQEKMGVLVKEAATDREVDHEILAVPEDLTQPEPEYDDDAGEYEEEEA
jgi:hypothetical protein